MLEDKLHHLMELYITGCIIHDFYLFRYDINRKVFVIISERNGINSLSVISIGVDFVQSSFFLWRYVFIFVAERKNKKKETMKRKEWQKSFD